MRIAELVQELASKEDALTAVGGEESSGSAARKPQGHGGWLPKCAKLIKAYRQGNWATCEQLMERYFENPIVATNCRVPPLMGFWLNVGVWLL